MKMRNGFFSFSMTAMAVLTLSLAMTTALLAASSLQMAAMYEKKVRLHYLADSAVREGWQEVQQLLDRYGLFGWRIHVVIGGPDMIWKRIPLATADAAEARELIRGAGLLDEEGQAYGFDLACPEKNRDGLYDWIVGAYPSDCIEALCRSVVDADAVLASLDLLPAFFGRIQSEGQGFLSFRDEKVLHTVHLQNGRPLAYELQEGAPLSEGASPFMWQGDGDTEGRPLSPSAAVAQVMERYGLSQATASLILL